MPTSHLIKPWSTTPAALSVGNSVVVLIQHLVARLWSDHCLLSTSIRSGRLLQQQHQPLINLGSHLQLMASSSSLSPVARSGQHLRLATADHFYLATHRPDRIAFSRPRHDKRREVLSYSSSLSCSIYAPPMPSALIHFRWPTTQLGIL